MEIPCKYELFSNHACQVVSSAGVLACAEEQGHGGWEVSGYAEKRQSDSTLVGHLPASQML